MTDADLDAWLASLLGDEGGVGLVAVGSHGRGDRAPFSDLDLVLVHDGARSADEVAALADRVWYPIWDRKLGLDHSVRTVDEALAVADGDLKAMLGLLDARLVAGDDALATRIVRDVEQPFGAIAAVGHWAALHEALRLRGAFPSRAMRFPLRTLSDKEAALVGRAVAQMDRAADKVLASERRFS
jgi:hypothetical protein